MVSKSDSAVNRRQGVKGTGRGRSAAPCSLSDYGGFIETALPRQISQANRRRPVPPLRRSSRDPRRRQRCRRCPRRAAWARRDHIHRPKVALRSKVARVVTRRRRFGVGVRLPASPRPVPRPSALRLGPHGLQRVAAQRKLSPHPPLMTTSPISASPCSSSRTTATPLPTARIS